MHVLVTGGKGYIGSHVVKELRDHGVNVTSLDIVDGVDICDERALDGVFSSHSITHVIHTAALKSVSESFLIPERYFEVNVGGTKNIIAAMKRHKVNNIIFSSSATVYDDATQEDSELRAINPYGETKIACEREIKQSGLNYAILRFFNPIGHYEGMAEKITSPNLFTSCVRSLRNAVPLTLYGNCIRDYFFIGDLARFHHHLLNTGFNNLTLNFGTGNGMSTSDFIMHFNRVNCTTLQTISAPPRLGDKQCCVADVTRFRQLYPTFQFSPVDRWFVL